MGELITALTQVKDSLSFLSPPELTGHKNMVQRDVSKAIGGAKMTWLDNKYIAVSQKEFQKIIDWDWTDNKKYVAEKYDCDNFAFSFKARVDRKFHVNTVGLVIDYDGGHAYNIIVFSDGTSKIFEPQSDSWPTMGRGMYAFNRANVNIII